MISLFVDSNIWLSLYDFSKDDLVTFSKLSSLINKDVKLLLPYHVKREVHRNRENKINATLRNFNPCSLSIPNIYKGYDEYNRLYNMSKELNALQKELSQRVNRDAEQGQLQADRVINEIFNKITFFQEPDFLVERAKARYDLGNPPGKDGKYGDAINWVSLLEYAPVDVEIFFVSADKDYCSVLNNKKFNSYLKKEWNMLKRSELHFYTCLSDFFSEKLPQIELSSEKEKNDVISSLMESGTFRETHRIIARLQEYTSWTPNQVSALCQAVTSNNQVSQIIGDDDIHNFFSNILRDYNNENENEDIEAVRTLLMSKELEESDSSSDV